MSKLEWPDPYDIPDDMGRWDHCIAAGEQMEDVLIKAVEFSFHSRANIETALDWLAKRRVSHAVLIELGVVEE